MAQPGEMCTTCFVGSLELHEGMLVCDVCGSITHVSPAPPPPTADRAPVIAGHCRRRRRLACRSPLLLPPPCLQGFAEEAQEFQTGISDARHQKCGAHL